MSSDFVNHLINFILRAKQASYVGGGEKLLPYRLGSHDLQFHEGDWVYHDCYFGESDFIGGEIVYYQGRVVWGMNYYGRIIQPKSFTSAEAGAMIQQSLSKMYQSGRFLGGYQHSSGELTYTDTNDGDALNFTGKEWIEKDGEIVYSLIYHGGLINE